MSVAAFSGSFEFLGSKISLITETKIRYEGILYRVDTQECTLSLSGGMSRLSTIYIFYNHFEIPIFSSIFWY